MQFLIIAYDGTDEGALARRLAVRDQHIALSDAAMKRGEQLMGVALLNDKGDMCGSMMMVEFRSRVELDAWLNVEPYVTGGVWQDIAIHPCRVGPSFMHVFRPDMCT